MTMDKQAVCMASSTLKRPLASCGAKIVRMAAYLSSTEIADALQQTWIGASPRGTRSNVDGRDCTPSVGHV